MSSPLSLVLSVRRKAPELIAPVKQIKRELKQLSDIDDQGGLRFQVPLIFFYKNDPSMKCKDPVSIIREALGRALVYYYPLAGRLREGTNRKLMVDCTGEGILFIEADANMTLEQLGDAIQPPCPCLDELLYNVPGSEGILECPLLLIQVTRLTCGGFILALRFNHTMVDGPGLVQFLDAVAEIARGCHTPSVLPIWHRELFNAREPPCITHIHHEYEQLTNTNDTLAAMDTTNMSHQSFFFGPQEIKAMRDHLPPHLKNCTTFELLTACLWKCRTVALELNPDDTVRVSCAMNVRGKFKDLKVPPGYYGNAFVYPAAVSMVNLLCKNPLGYAVELVKKVKAQMSGEYIKSVADLMVIKGRPLHTTIGNFIVSDNTNNGIEQVNFGWGKPVYGGVAGATSLISFYMRYHKQGVDGIVVPLRLPLTAMGKFQQELKIMTQEPLKGSNNLKSIRILSTL